MREYRYRVDAEGRVFHDGTEIVDPAVLRFFLRAMTRTEAGAWLVLCQGERNWFEVDDDTPFVVQRVRVSPGEDGRPATVELALAGGLTEPLDPTTLAVDGDRLTCRSRGGVARFGRIALQQLAPLLIDEGGGDGPDGTGSGNLALALGNTRYPIRRASPGPPARPSHRELPAERPVSGAPR